MGAFAYPSSDDYDFLDPTKQPWFRPANASSVPPQVQPDTVPVQPPAQSQGEPSVQPEDTDTDQPRPQFPDLTPQVQAVHESNQDITNKAMELANQDPYQFQKRGIGSRLAEGLTGFIAPSVAHAIWQEPREEQYKNWQIQQGQNKEVLGALNEARTGATSELNTAIHIPVSQAQFGWMNQRPGGRQPITMQGPDGKPHFFGYNRQTGKYDTDMGINTHEDNLRPRPPQSVAPGNYVQDDSAPGGYRQVGTPPRLEAPQRPTDAETKINLYRTNPEQFRAIYGQGADTALMRIAEAASKNALGEVDPQKMLQVYQTLQTSRGNGKPGGGNQEPTVNPAAMSSHRQPQAKQLDEATAADYMQRAGGDKDQARAMARKDGYTF